MFDKAIITASANSTARDVECQARSLRSLGVREIFLTHAIDVFDDAGRTWRGQADAEAAFESQLNDFEAHNMRVHVEAPLGHPARLLGEMSDEHGAKLIVVDAGNVALFGTGLSLGRAPDMMAASETPILVRPLCPARLDPHQIGERVLFATDFSPTAARAFVALVDIVRGCRSWVDLLHVQEPAESEHASARDVAESDRRDAIRLSRLKDRLLAEGASAVSAEVIDGSPAEEIAKRSASSRYSLVLMGSRGDSGESDGILGAVSESVTRAAAVPVLLVPPARPTLLEARGKAVTAAV